MELMIKRAFSLYFANTGNDVKKQFAEQEWPKSSEISRKANMKNLLNNKTNPTPDTIKRVCEITNTSPNFIFGWDIEEQ